MLKFIWLALYCLFASYAIPNDLLDVGEFTNNIKSKDTLSIKLVETINQSIDVARCPQLWEANRFPPPSITDTYMTYNRSCQENMKTLQQLDYRRTSEEYDDIQKNNNYILTILSIIKDATDHKLYITARRLRLRHLREMVDAQFWLEGGLPCPVDPRCLKYAD